MYLKELSKPIRAIILEKLVQRLLDGHPKTLEIQQDLVRILAGYKGERAVSYYLDFLPDKDFFIFHSLRLPSKNHFFQIDFLLLTNRFALILECKNFFGTLYFDESFNQLIRTANDKEEGFQDPLSQAKWHQQQLRNWLSSNGFNLPFDYYVVISNPSTIVKTSPQNKQALDKVVHGHSLLNRIGEVNRKYEKQIYDGKTIRKLSKLLIKRNTQESFDLLKKYGIKEEEILTGVRCPECGYMKMIHRYGTWRCPMCQLKRKDAHLESLKDYSFLVKPTITNQEFRKFFHVHSPDVANYLLKSMNLPHSGSTKGRVYYLNEEFRNFRA
ncbi:NERD domain-containing protein [Robertmurraya massiliosenegalensis]|uniref:NERD domain-containing protein n=1 Tax=Robertmurraya TaxID=2837507 RepID=UPI0039A57159